MAFVRVEAPVKDWQDNKIKDIYFRGAWEEEGETRWAFFKATEIEKETMVTDEQQETKKPYEEHTPEVSLTSQNEYKEDIRQEEEKKSKESSTEKLAEEVVSITELGHNMMYRYSSDLQDKQKISQEENKEESKKSQEDMSSITDLIKTLSSCIQPVTDDGLIDHRELLREDKIKVFFVEDNRSFQIILKTLIGNQEEIELMGWASDGKEAIEKIKNLSSFPDVILMDIAMPEMDGISATKELLKTNPYASIIMLTAFGDRDHVVDAFEAGAAGFLRKDASLPLIKEAIKQAAKGGRPVHKEVARYAREVKKIVKEEYIEISPEIKEKPFSDKKQPPVNIEILQQKEKLLKEDITGEDSLKKSNKNSTEISETPDEITKKILYYKSMLREYPERINEIIEAYIEMQKKYPENTVISIALGSAYFKKNLLKEGLMEYSKTLYDRDLLSKIVKSEK